MPPAATLSGHIFTLFISVTLILSLGIKSIFLFFFFNCLLPWAKKSMNFLCPPIAGLGKMWERNSWFSGETTNFQKEAFPTSPWSPRRAPCGANALQGNYWIEPLTVTYLCASACNNVFESKPVKLWQQSTCRCKFLVYFLRKNNSGETWLLRYCSWWNYRPVYKLL